MRVEKLRVPTTGRLLIVGDLHGQKIALEHVMDAFGFDAAMDVLVTTGNLIDGGEESMSMLKLLSFDWFHSVLGHHELVALKALTGDFGTITWAQSVRLWAARLGDADRERISDRLRRLPDALLIEQGGMRVGVVHASVPPAKAFETGVMGAERDGILYGPTPLKCPPDLDYLVVGPRTLDGPAAADVVCLDGGGQVVIAIDLLRRLIFRATPGTLTLEMADVAPLGFGRAA